jgi:hypothetical protein
LDRHLFEDRQVSRDLRKDRVYPFPIGRQQATAGPEVTTGVANETRDRASIKRRYPLLDLRGGHWFHWNEARTF